MRYIFVLLLFVSSAPFASSEIIYDMFFRVGAFDGLDETLVVDPNSSIGDVQLILRETTTAGEDSAMEAGVRSIGINVLSTHPNSFTSQTPNSEFATPNGAGTDEDTLFSFSLFGLAASQRISSNVVEFTMGTIDLVGPPVAEETTFALEDFDTGQDNFLLASGAIDNLVTPRTLTITAIPEPSAVLMLAAIGACVSVRRRRRA